MKSRVCILAICFGLVLSALICWELKVRSQSEPVYHGKPLRDWVREVEVNKLFHEPPPEAVAALHAIGPAGFPNLIRWLGPTSPDSFFFHELKRFVPIRLPTSEKQPTPSAVTAAFECLGPEARLAIPGLSNVLHKSRVDLTSVYAARSLGCLGPGAVPALIAGLTNSHPEMRPERLRWVRKEILEQFALMPSNSASAAPVILRFVNGDDNELRGKALLALGFTGEATEETIHVLQAALDDKDPSVRGGAAMGLAGLGAAAKAAAPQLVRLLDGDDWYACLGALEFFAQMNQGADIPMPQIVKLLEDPHPVIRRVAAHTLGSLGDPQTSKALTRMTNDADGAVRMSALDALKKIEARTAEKN